MKTNLFSGAIGASIGGYTQYDSKDPNAAYTAAGAAVGGIAGARMDYGNVMQPVNRLKQSLSSTAMSSIDTGNVFLQNLQKTQDQYAKKASRFREKVAGLDASINALSRTNPADVSMRAQLAMEKQALIDRTLNNVNFVLGDKGGFKSMSEVDKFVSTSISQHSGATDVKRLMGINTGMSFTSELKSVGDVILPNPTKPTFNPIFTGSGNMDNAIEKLTTHLGTLGYKDPGKEARLFLESKDIQGMKIGINEHAIQVSQGKQSVNIPLTKTYDNGARTATVLSAFKDSEGMIQTAGTEMNVGTFNPYAREFLRGNKTQAEMLEAMDPLRMVQFSENLEGSTPMERLRSAQRNIESMMTYHPDTQSTIGINKSQMINIGGFTLQDEKIRALSTSNFNSGSPAYVQVAEKLEGPIFAASSTNSFAHISDPNFVRPETPYAFGVHERGGESVLHREQQMLSGADFATGTRTDTSKDLNKVFARAFGPEFVLGDGHMLANLANEDDFSVVGRAKLMLGNFGTKDSPAFGSSIEGLDEVLAAVKAGDHNKKRMLLDLMPDITANTPIGLSAEGSSVSLKDYFHSGRIKDISITDQGISLEMAGRTSPGQSGWAKIFSQGSKAGVSFMPATQFNAALAMSKLHNSGAFSVVDNKGLISFNRETKIGSRTYGAGMQLGAENLRAAVGSAISGNEFAFNNRSVSLGSSLIGDFESGGQDIVGKILAGDKEATSAFFNKYQDKPGLGGYVSKFRSGSTSQQAAGARALLALTDTKSSRDVVDTAISRGFGTKEQFIQAKRDMLSGDASRVSAGTGYFLNTVKRSYLPLDIANIGDTVTSWTGNYAEGIHGIGNAGKFSHLEIAQLKANGYTEEMISKLGVKDNAALHELEMIRSSIGAGQNPSGNISAVYGKDVSERAAYLKSQGITPDSGKGFTSINIETRGMGKDQLGILSVPVSEYDTGRSGLFLKGEDEIVKRLDKARASVLSGSYAYQEALAGGSAGVITDAKESYAAALSNLDLETKGALRGDNNLMKAASRLHSDSSMIMMARTIGGDAGDYAKKELSQNNLVSFTNKATAIDFAKQSGLDILDSTGNIKASALETVAPGIQRLKVGESGRWMQQISREPAQGPGSTMMMELLIDNNLGNESKGHIFSPQIAGMKKNLQELYSFLDYDADALRVASMHKMSSKEIQMAQKRQGIINQEFMRMAGLQSKMGVKGSSISPDVLTSFVDKFQKWEHETAAALKGKYRKPIAAEATKTVLNIQEAVMMDLGDMNNESAIRRSVHARNMAHNLTENLLKTSHKKTGDPGLFSNSAIAQLGELQQNFGARAISKEAYMTEFSSIIDKTLGSDMASFTKDEMDVYVTARNNISNSMANHSRDIQAAKAGILDMGEYIKPSTSYREMVGGIDKIGFGGGHFPGVASDDLIKNTIHRAKASLPEASNVIMATLRENKGKMLAAAAALGGLAAISGSRGIDTEPLASAQPASSKKQAVPLEPFKDRKAYIRKYGNKGGSYSINARVKGDRDNMNRKSINNILFGDKMSTARINISDNSGI